MPDSAQNDLIAAHHEGGHAVCAILLQVPIGVTSLKALGSGFGGMEPVKISKIRELNLGWEYAVVLELGPATEKLFHGRFDEHLCREDEEGIERLYTEFFQNQTRKHYREELKTWAKHIMAHPRFREAVDEVAHHLVKDRDAQPEWVAEVVDRLCPPYTPPGR
jgi:hypothetical protein